MPFDPENFLVLAAELAGRTAPREAEVRTAISRAYYAAFLAVRTHAVARSFFRAYGTGDDHRLLVRTMRQQPDPVLRGIADGLRGLRDRRNLADYDLTLTPTVNVAQLAVAQARAIIADLPRTDT